MDSGPPPIPRVGALFLGSAIETNGFIEVYNNGQGDIVSVFSSPGPVVPVPKPVYGGLALIGVMGLAAVRRRRAAC